MRTLPEILKTTIHGLGRQYINKINEDEANSQIFRRHNERPIELRFIFDCMIQLRPITVLDVGTGTTALPSLLASCGCVVTAIDNIRDYWPNGMVNRHWHVMNENITNPTIKKTFDLITCISVIEHIENDARAFQSMIGLLNPGGHLILTMPYNERLAVPNVYDLPDTAYGGKVPYICRSISRNELGHWLKATGTEIVRQEFWEVWSGSVWAQGMALPVPRQVGAADPHQLTCVLVRKP